MDFSDRSSCRSPSLAPPSFDAFASPVIVAVDVAPKHMSHIQMGQWSAGLCGCLQFCVPNCCMAICCPCVSVAQIATRLGFKYSTVFLAFGLLVVLEYVMYLLAVATQHSTKSDGINSVHSFHVNVWSYLSVMFTVAILIALWRLRTMVRDRFHLPGSCVEDCLISWCCSWCSLAQIATHVKSYKPHSCDFGPPDELPGYSTLV